jgi:hypothetical protein
MPYIGKPQSADPITVNTSNIDDGTIQAVDISSSFREHISGSFQGGGSNKISGSLTSTGSFGKVEVGSGKITTTGNMVLDADGAQIRLEDGGTEFGRISRVSSDLVIKSISNNNDILFKGVDGSSTITALQLDMSEAGNAIFNNDVTIAGTLTAQEIHTEFTSASILFTSGSTIFGNSSDDVHNMTGSLNISGSLFVKDGTLTVTDNVDFNGDLDVDGTTNLDVVDIDGAVDMASTLKAGDTILGQTGNQKGKLTIQSRTGAATRKTNAIVAVPYNDTSESICMIGMDGQSSNNEMHIGSNTSDFMSPTFIDFFTASDVNSQTNNRVMRITSAGNVGIGTDNPGSPLDVRGTSSEPIVNFGDAASRDADGHDIFGSDSFRYQFQNGTPSRPAIIEGGGDIAANEAAVYFTGFSSSQTDGHRNLGGMIVYRKNTGGGDSGQYGSQLQFRTKADGTATPAQTMVLEENGRLGINIGTPIYKLDVHIASATHVARFRNAGDNYNMHGIIVSAGKSSPVSAGDCNYIFFQDGGGTGRGGIRNSSTADNPEFFNGSDLRMKKDVAETKVNGLETINAIPLKEWNWNSKKEKPKTDIGIVADDLEKVLPELVSQQISLEGWEHCVKDGEEPLKTIPTETKLTLILMKAVQELSKDNDDLKKRIEELEK